MIETLKLRNFKVLRGVDVKLRPLTVIVGPNGSGKSTLLEALQDAVSIRLPTSWESRGLLSRVPKGLPELRFSGTFSGKRLEGFAPEFDRHAFMGEGSWEGKPLLRGKFLPNGLKEALGRADLYRFDVRSLSSPSVPKSVSLQLPFDGKGLSSLLAGLYLKDIARFQSLVERLKRVIPSVEGFHIEQAAVENESTVGYQIVFDMKGAKGIPATSISDGTLLTLALLTALVTTDRAQLILVDDLERGLHPKAVGDLVQQLRRIQEEDPELQVVATSHSPYLVDFLRAEEVLLTSLDEEGYAVIKSLSDHPDYERSKDFFDTGEFWSTVGEGWVTKPSASPSSR
jgi:predicted ATPase